MTLPHSLYRQVMGEAFDLLAPELKSFHGCSGRVRLAGRCSVTGPRTAAARILGWLFRLPRAVADAPLTFVLEASPTTEIWQRHFPGRLMVSRMHAEGPLLVERLGAVDLHFALRAMNGALSMRLERVTLWGMACPAWLFPQVRAEERATPGELHFDVAATLPGLGLLVAYRGALDIRACQTINLTRGGEDSAGLNLSPR